MKIKIIVPIVGVIAIVVILIIAGPPDKKTIGTPEGNFTVLNDTVIVGGKSVTVISDSNRNVTCWIYSGGQRGGISCIPNWQLTSPQNMSSNCSCG